MPLTPLQIQILKTIAINRGQDSYIAGAIVQHIDNDSPRFSDDLDLFHDLQEKVAQCAEQDAAVLTENGYNLQWLLRTPSFHRAVILAEKENVRIEWAQDSAFRFFPLQDDPICGFRLHKADAAVNKMLTLAGRQEVRDFVDILHLNDTYLSIGSMAWAACGKDPGYTPDFILEQAARHTAYTQEDVNRLNLKKPLDLHDMKRKWLKAHEEARGLISFLPPEDIGCLYLNQGRQPVTPSSDPALCSRLIRHHGRAGGSWPTVK